MLLLNLIIYIFAFILIWFGAGLIVKSTSKFAEKLRLSSFAVSFLLLGILTSTPEFSVGLHSIFDKTPEIFVGNLIGGIIVIFLLIIPLLAVFGNGINLKNEMDHKMLVATFSVVMAPSIAILDKRVTTIEGFVLIGLYLALIYLIERKNGLFDRRNEKILDKKSYSYRDILKVILGIALVFISSVLIVNNTIYFANLFSIPAFYIGLLVIAVGTDLPEISLAIRAVIHGKKEIAMGDYMGAAAASTLLFGIFTVLGKGEIITVNNFLLTFGFILLGVGLLYYFFRVKNFISRKNGLFMIGIYIAFVILELVR